ncbi:unnamed protein product [Microthlaspi erraticum]|uniref:Matrin-type domain-containing protein n=1 Tax=Microthlaspi erraticum TaxID=1685480 RepID=A0A6D2IEI1_9BRAS|nr:unnamed protein product [Microthlaspi erraticum]
MSSTLIEQTRINHEEIERLERLIVKDLQTNPPSIKKTLAQGHRIRNMIESIILTTKKLNETYEDKDGSREDEISALGGSRTKVFEALEGRVKEIVEYHRNHPSGPHLVEDYEARLKEEPAIAFRGEEGSSGLYLDLHEMYNQYINSKFGEKVEYSAYLNVFSQLDKIQFNLKLSLQYKKYIEALLGYLINFFQRTEPLQDLERILCKVETDFEEQYAGGKGEIYALIDLDYYKTVEELIAVGPERLKEALGALGLKVGGTVRQRAERLFLTKHTSLEKLDKKHFTKQEPETAKEIALTEAKVKKLCVLLEETIERTKQYVVKKQSWTYEEMEEERRMDAESESLVNDEEEVEEEDGQINNPLKLPLGWDGKPIPFWLYNLHGLGHEFKCEICGDHVYKGRRAFEMHFKEGKHQSGMRSLGIPNTKHFNEITLIEEAKELWRKIQERQGENKWKPEVEEEFEDQEGNVYNKKTYSDLKRQGLI